MRLHAILLTSMLLATSAPVLLAAPPPAFETIEYGLGDVDRDGSISLSDIAAFRLWQLGWQPVEVLETMDLDGNGRADETDLLKLVAIVGTSPFRPIPVVRTRATFVRGDLDGDALISEGDHAILKELLDPGSTVGAVTPLDAADFDRDGFITEGDRAALRRWLDRPGS